MTQTASTHGFKAEVQQLLDLMIHSVYSDREVFLRELVSNAADALDKARYVGLTQELVGIGGEEPGIRVLVDDDAKTITIEDDGIGMSEAEVIKYLGTIAHSGSKEFLQRLKESEGGAPELIGQFGIGFYSSFMVADRVIVETRAAVGDEASVRWTSTGAGTYELEACDKQTRGTRIEIHLREDAAEFADESSLRAAVRKHSNFVSWPIHVGEEQANEGKALWLEPASSVSEEEANAFYRTVSTDWQDPALKIHVNVDMPVQYAALLFIPKEQPWNLHQNQAEYGPRLYARRVLIQEHARDLLPEWLRFVTGVVDSEDISLNVSREMVQKTRVVAKIKDALTKRILKSLGGLASANTLDADDKEAAVTRYEDIWRTFGALLKEGYYHSASNDKVTKLLLPLLRFNALSHEDDTGLISLQAYIDAMPESQDAIWYLNAESRQAALDSPHLEALRGKGFDVLLLTDPVDEWLVQVLAEFNEVPLKSVSRGDFGLDEDEEDEAERADLSDLVPWMEGMFEGSVSSVRASARLTDSAAVLVDDEAGISSNMERILRAANQAVPTASRILELNPKHPLIKNLSALHAAGRSEVAEPLARLLLDDALLVDGSLKEPTAMGRRLQTLLVNVSSRELGL
jgi:molecular chaperone HtpG